VYPTKPSKVLRLLEDLWVRKARREADNKDKITLDHSDIGQVLSVIGNSLLLGQIFLPFLGLDFGQLLRGEGLEVSRVFRVGRSTRGTKPAALGSDLVPTKSADLKEGEAQTVTYARQEKRGHYTKINTKNIGIFT
jgi:hypothetical protein